MKIIKVIYRDNSVKRFNPYEWEIFGEQIKKNLEQKDLCIIKHTLLYRILVFFGLQHKVKIRKKPSKRMLEVLEMIKEGVDLEKIKKK